MDNKDIALIAAIAKSVGGGGGSSSSIIDDTTASTSTTYSSTKIEQLLSGQLKSHIVTITQDTVQTSLWNFSETVGAISQRIINGEFVILKDVTSNTAPKYYFYTGLTGNESYQIYTDIVNDLTGSNYVEQFRISLNTSSTTTQASKTRFQILPATTSDDNGKLLGVANGEWGKISASESDVIYDGSFQLSGVEYNIALGSGKVSNVYDKIKQGKRPIIRVLATDANNSYYIYYYYQGTSSWTGSGARRITFSRQYVNYVDGTTPTLFIHTVSAMTAGDDARGNKFYGNTFQLTLPTT